jgi:nucleotide-binding universal stress UspA family protein
MHLLLGVGGGDAARVLETTIERARAAGDELTVAVYGDLDASEIESRVETLAGGALTVSVTAVDGDAGSRLVEIAERDGVDRIVLPGGQRSPLGKIRLDQVSEFVLLNAPMTVTLVR